MSPVIVTAAGKEGGALPGATVTATNNQTGGIARQTDARSNAITHNIRAGEFDRMPKARTFQDPALTGPSVDTGQREGGLQINGASGAGNACASTAS